MLQSKSVLARLLANENISVEQGNYPTAFFDVENRTLGLPLWKEMSADETDLLIGHEIGHALFTPQSKEEITVPGVQHSYMNVVEDIRIERKVLDKYPGLVSNFKRGYLGLMNRDIFGTKDNDINEMGFMDRLNLKAKGRDLVEVEFSEEEMPYFKKAMAVETFEDVANVCKELVAWLGDGKKEQKEDGDETTNGQSQSEESEMTAQDIADLFGESSEEQSEEGKPSDSDSDSDEIAMRAKSPVLVKLLVRAKSLIKRVRNLLMAKSLKKKLKRILRVQSVTVLVIHLMIFLKIFLRLKLRKLNVRIWAI